MRYPERRLRRRGARLNLLPYASPRASSFAHHSRAHSHDSPHMRGYFYDFLEACAVTSSTLETARTPDRQSPRAAPIAFATILILDISPQRDPLSIGSRVSASRAHRASFSAQLAHPVRVARRTWLSFRSPTTPPTPPPSSPRRRSSSPRAPPLPPPPSPQRAPTQTPPHPSRAHHSHHSTPPPTHPPVAPRRLSRPEPPLDSPPPPPTSLATSPSHVASHSSVPQYRSPTRVVRLQDAPRRVRARLSPRRSRATPPSARATTQSSPHT